MRARGSVKKGLIQSLGGQVVAIARTSARKVPGYAVGPEPAEPGLLRDLEPHRCGCRSPFSYQSVPEQRRFYRERAVAKSFWGRSLVGVKALVIPM